MAFRRSSGILLHPTSLPGPGGIGELGPAAYEFVDFLADTNQGLWQVLPLGPTGFGDSPYMSYSAMAGNPLLISLEWLQDQGLLAPEDLKPLGELNRDQVDFHRVQHLKIPLLKRACQAFLTQATPQQRQEFADFCQEKADWLNDYALFMALKEAHGDSSWSEWPEELAGRQPKALHRAAQSLEASILYHQFLQYQFLCQWRSVRRYAHSRGVQIIGDIPIYVAYDSADVWSHRENFSLDPETLKPLWMAGVPPDYFSNDGQLWGNPTYNWEYLRKSGFAWWIDRFQKALLDYVDLVRIDHFRGFEAYWAVPQGETTAVNGKWMEAPGVEFFQELSRQLGDLPILAEDLGVITPEVVALRDKFGFPGMKVLHFAFGSDVHNPFLPHNYDHNFATVYTGTHDNNTTRGWFEALGDEEKDRVVSYLGGISPAGITWDLIRLAMGSVAKQAIFPLQDVLGLGAEARMNLPGTAQGNWRWRYRAEAITGKIKDQLRNLTQIYGRAASS